MKTKLFAFVFLTTAMLSLASKAGDSYIETESYEVASLIINLARNITRDLAPPATGAERTVTSAVVSEDANNRVYLIEGRDVYHTGRVLNTYWLRLSKSITTGTMTNAVFSMNDVSEPVRGRALPLETQRLIGPLLNGLYDIAEFDLDHRRVVVEDIADADPDTIQIVGLNDICEHDDLNRFRITMTRRFERNRTSYETVIEKPYGIGTVLPAPPESTMPWPVPAPIEPIPGTSPNL